MRNQGPRPLSDVVRYASVGELEELVIDLANELDIRCDAHDDDRLMSLLARARRATGDRR